MRTVCHNVSVESGWRACVQISGQARAKEPADTDLQGLCFLDFAMCNGKRFDFHMFDLAGHVCADAAIVGHTAPSNLEG